MRKFFFNCLVIMTVTFLSIGFVSCSKDDPKEDSSQPTIIGTWTWIENDESYTFSEMYTFNPDGTFKLVWQELTFSGEESGTWLYDTNDHKLTLNTIIGEKRGPYTYTVILQGNQMTLIEADGDVNGPYTKQ